MELFIKGHNIITFDKNKPFIAKGIIYIKDGTIKNIYTNEENLPDKNALVLGEDYVIFPGFINAHNHLYSSLARGIPLKKTSRNFIQILENLWWRLDKVLDEESIYYSAIVGFIDAVTGGTTTIIDHHSSPNYIKNSLSIISEAAKKMGIRCCLCYEVSDRDGKEKKLEGIEENYNFIKNNHSDFISGLFGLHASFTLNDDTLKAVKDAVSDLKTGIHIHLCEDKADFQDSIKKYNCSPLKRLEKFELVNEKSIFAHSIHLDKSDFDILKRYNTNVVHNPRSNMNNAVGSINLKNFTKNNILVALGSDGMASNILPELETAVWLQKHITQDPTFGFVESVNTLMNNSTLVEKIWGIKVGKIKEGYKGDFAIFKYLSPTPLNENNWMGHLIFGLCREKVAYTIINGKIIYEKGNINGLSIRKILLKSQKIAQSIWEKY